VRARCAPRRVGPRAIAGRRRVPWLVRAVRRVRLRGRRAPAGYAGEGGNGGEGGRRGSCGFLVLTGRGLRCRGSARPVAGGRWPVAGGRTVASGCDISAESSPRRSSPVPRPFLARCDATGPVAAPSTSS
jgi:hypothetical protein